MTKLYTVDSFPTYLLKLKNVGLAQSNLDGANLSGVDLSGANLSENSLCETNLTNAKLIDAFFDGCTRMLGCNLTEADFTGVNLDGVWMERNIYYNTIMPNSTIKTGKD
ncbi:pentapeptide repeat-containing protein [Chamaesiphon minutus]|uniref:pentapeptide repeat-containing protein n=1 Tax=Chamaesiphon minutus TaxID=1173032 RepID=UPI0012F9C545|nr:pentapeptide repeat-containing protein [Chamaesiphon minutus]